jgi:hypothetical protein
MNIDPVQQRPGNFRHAALDHRLSGMAIARAVVEISAWRRVLSLLKVSLFICPYQRHDAQKP